MRYYVCDFETTVYEGQTETEVWAAAAVEMYTEKVQIWNSIDGFFIWCEELTGRNYLYFHNGAFDFSFILDYLKRRVDYTEAIVKPDDGKVEGTYFLRDKEMYPRQYTYSIADSGLWYTLTVKTDSATLEFRDSLKLIPFSVKVIGKSFKTKHQKSSIEYEGERHAGGEITEEERHYIANDVLVVKEGLEVMFNEGHKKLTIGACCMTEFKGGYHKSVYSDFFPNVYNIDIDPEIYGKPNVGEYVRRSYRGGWCYVVPEKAGKIHRNGITLDVNSLYPSMMHSESGNFYPVGKPTFFEGADAFESVRRMAANNSVGDAIYYFVRIKTRFYLKYGKLPFIQLKNNMRYRQNESLRTSDVFIPDLGRYVSEYTDQAGNHHDTRVEMTLTMTDFDLICEHYLLVDFEVLDGCYFWAERGIFDKYIDKYKLMKMNAETPGRRTIAKLYLNNLYGKMAASTISNFKVAYLNPEKDCLSFYSVEENEKLPGYIPVGSAITSYARNFTIRAAQANYYGPDKPGFIYADTDSLHIDMPIEKIKGVTIHPTEFCCWKHEACWDIGLFTRQKTYIEHITAEPPKEVEPYYNVKCAGMNDRTKEIFMHSVLQDYDIENNPDKYYPDELEFMRVKRELTDFKVGLKVPGKLHPKRIKGGIVLERISFEMH